MLLGVFVKSRPPFNLVFLFNTKNHFVLEQIILHKIPTRTTPKFKRDLLEFDSKGNSPLLGSTDQLQSTFFFHFEKHVGDEMRPMQPSRIMPPPP